MKKLKLTEREAGRVEGYADALNDLLGLISDPDRAGKSYDPMTVELKRGLMHSYLFNMKDGGRHHPISDYVSVQEIYAQLLCEACDQIDYSRAEGEGIFFDMKEPVRMFSRSHRSWDFPQIKGEPQEGFKATTPPDWWHPHEHRPRGP